MDTRTGEIISAKRFSELMEEERKYFIEMSKSPSKKQMERKPPKVGRNDPCPCGSGKKFKKCHGK